MHSEGRDAHIAELSGQIDTAMKVAKEAHGDQIRRYTEEFYWYHPLNVAKMLLTIPEGVSKSMVIAACLHDVLEDCPGWTAEKLISSGVPLLASCLVNELTDQAPMEFGNRAERKAVERWRLSNASGDAQTIKYADLICNLKSIVEHDKKFAPVFLREMLALLVWMDRGNPFLRRMAFEYAEVAQRVLKKGWTRGQV